MYEKRFHSKVKTLEGLVMLSRLLTATTQRGDAEVLITLQSPIQGDGFWECAFEIH